MHPLSTSLDTGTHEFRHDGRVARRRSSLDNSCLSADESVKLILRQTAEDEQDREDKRPRRLSLNHNSCIAVTFLAASSDPALKKANDLDMDCHDSVHDRMKHVVSPKPAISFGGVELEGSENDDQYMQNDMLSDDFDSDSDCDSFCDASVQEPANKEYLVKDLGASAIWSGEASLSDWHIGSEEFMVPDAIEEESDDENSMHSPPSLATELIGPALPQRTASAGSGNRSSSSQGLLRRNPLKLYRKQQRT